VSKAARLFHALSDEARLHIIEQLQRVSHASVTLPRHLRQGVRDFRFGLYYLANQKAIEDLQEVVKSLTELSPRLAEAWVLPLGSFLT
jgi:hypothetical protein